MGVFASEPGRPPVAVQRSWSPAWWGGARRPPHWIRGPEGVLTWRRPARPVMRPLREATAQTRPMFARARATTSAARVIGPPARSRCATRALTSQIAGGHRARRTPHMTVEGAVPLSAYVEGEYCYGPGIARGAWLAVQGARSRAISDTRDRTGRCGRVSTYAAGGAGGPRGRAARTVGFSFLSRLAVSNLFFVPTPVCGHEKVIRLGKLGKRREIRCRGPWGHF